jgi:hypothetical protein
MQAPLKADFNLTAPINAVLGSQDRSYNILTFHSTELELITTPYVPNSSNVLLSSNQTYGLDFKIFQVKTAMRLQALVLL